MTISVLPEIERPLSTVPTKQEVFVGAGSFWPLSHPPTEITRLCPHMISKHAIEIISDLYECYGDALKIKTGIKALPGRYVLFKYDKTKMEYKAVHVGASPSDLVLLVAGEIAHKRRYEHLLRITERLSSLGPGALIAVCDDLILDRECPDYVRSCLSALLEGARAPQTANSPQG